MKKEDSNLELTKYETIIFGSGIYFSKPHKKLLEFLNNYQIELKGKKIIAVITAGMRPNEKDVLRLKEFAVKNNL